NGNYNVTIGSTVSPGQININSSGAYTFSGAGSIAGTPSVNKTGVGTVTISDTGPNALGFITVNQGTLTATMAGGLGNGNALLINPTGTSGTSADAATVNSNGSLGNTSSVTVNTNSATAIGTLNLNGTSDSMGALNGTGVVNLANTSGTALSIG